MPIKPEMRGFYPNNWPEISRRVRFERAAGICQGCGRPHGMTIRCLPDGRWFDSARHIWRNGRGRPARWPNLEEAAQMRAAHLDHDPSNNRLRNLKSLCQRCHLIHDLPHHLARRRITYLLRRALGDLFLGPLFSLLWASKASLSPRQLAANAWGYNSWRVVAMNGLGQSQYARSLLMGRRTAIREDSFEV